MFSFSNTLFKRIISCAFIISTIFILGCGGGGGSTPPPAGGTGGTGTENVTVSWTANRESKVNEAGGGYLVYIGQPSGFDINGAGVKKIDVKYVSGATLTATSARATLDPGTHYVRIRAYGLVSGSVTNSGLTVESSIIIP